MVFPERKTVKQPPARGCIRLNTTNVCNHYLLFITSICNPHFLTVIAYIIATYLDISY